MFAGLRSLISQVPNLSEAKAWYTEVLGFGPYFDEPFYVGFNVGGFELGLDPDTSEQKPGPGGSVTYWGVASMTDTVARLEKEGVTVRSQPRDVGGGIIVAAIEDPFGNLIGLIENPHFAPPA